MVLKTNFQYSVILIISLVFIFVYSLLTLNTPLKFTSPDETVNYFFTNLYSNTGELGYHEPLNEITYGYTRPRNAITVNNNVFPSGFTGFYIVYGAIAAMDENAVPYITPILAILGGTFIYLLSTALFDKKVALLSLLLLLTLTPYWYWSNMSMFNNIAATVFFVGGVTFMVLSIQKNKLVYYLLTASCFGINHILRLTDITYFIPLLFLIYKYRKNLSVKYLIFAIPVYISTVLPLFILNNIFFGSFFSFGYNPGLASESEAAISAIYKKVSFFLLPSGINFSNMITNLFTYILKLSPILFLIGLLGFIIRKKYGSEIANHYGIFYLLLSLWILVYYGSGIFWGINSFSMDSSYIRYFLPIYVLIIPLAAFFITRLNRQRALLISFLIITQSVINVFFLTNGLDSMKTRRTYAYSQSRYLIEATEKDSVIITNLSDKVLFPERKVVIYGPIFKEQFDYRKLVKIISNLTSRKEILYFYNDRKDIDTNRLQSLLESENILLQEHADIESLFRVVTRK